MRELPIRRVSFWLRRLNSVKFRSTDRPVSFFPFFISFISFLYFWLFFVCLFLTLFPSNDEIGRLQVSTGWSCHCVLKCWTKPTKIGRTIWRIQREKRVQSGGQRKETRVSIVHLRAVSVCTRACVLSPTSSGTSGILPWFFFLLFVDVSCFSLAVWNRKEHTSLFNLRYHPTRFVGSFRWNLSCLKHWYGGGGGLAICYLPGGMAKSSKHFYDSTTIYNNSTNTNWRSLCKLKSHWSRDRLFLYLFFFIILAGYSFFYFQFFRCYCFAWNCLPYFQVWSCCGTWDVKIVVPLEREAMKCENDIQWPASTVSNVSTSR